MTETPPDVPPEWRTILRRGERILWQGGPQQAFHWHKRYNSSLVGAAAGVLVLFFLTDPDTWVVFAIWLIIIGSVIGPPILDAVKRQFSFFTLTDQRAFIGTALPVLGRRLASFPIDKDTEISFDQGALSAIYFAHEMRPSKHGEYRVDIGFENIRNGSEVYDLMKQIKEGTL